MTTMMMMTGGRRLLLRLRPTTTGRRGGREFEPKDKDNNDHDRNINYRNDNNDDGDSSSAPSPSNSPLTESFASVDIMRSHPVHALSLSYPYLAAASGNMLGIWRVDWILADMRRSQSRSRSRSRSWEEQRPGGERSSAEVDVDDNVFADANATSGDDDGPAADATQEERDEAEEVASNTDNYDAATLGTDDPVVVDPSAAWATGVERCASRITCVAISGEGGGMGQRIGGAGDDGDDGRRHCRILLGRFSLCIPSSSS